MIWHQDQGSQYTSYSYVNAIAQVGIISFSTKGTPTDNPGQESFFGRFKDEWANDMYELQTQEKLKRFIKSKINYYNNQRRHTSIDYIAPKTFTKKFLKK